MLRLRVRVGTSERQGYYIASFDDPSRFVELMPVDVRPSPRSAISGRTLCAHNLKAPRWRLVRIEQSDPHPQRWRTIVPESELPIEYAAVFNNCLVVKHIENLGARCRSSISMAEPVAHASSATFRACGLGAAAARTTICCWRSKTTSARAGSSGSTTRAHRQAVDPGGPQPPSTTSPIRSCGRSSSPAVTAPGADDAHPSARDRVDGTNRRCFMAMADSVFHFGPLTASVRRLGFGSAGSTRSPRCAAAANSGSHGTRRTARAEAAQL